MTLPEPKLISEKLHCQMIPDDALDLLSEYRANLGYSLPKPSLKPNYEDTDPEEEPKSDKDSPDPMSLRGCLDQKQLNVLFSSFAPNSRASPYYCIEPWIVNMNFYSSSDIQLGSFLNTCCFSANYKCPNIRVCGQPMSNHIRR